MTLTPETPLRDCGLSSRTFGMLHREGMAVLGDVADRCVHDFESIYRFGDVALHEVRRLLQTAGLGFSECPHYGAGLEKLALSSRVLRRLWLEGIDSPEKLAEHCPHELLDLWQMGATLIGEVVRAVNLRACEHGDVHEHVRRSGCVRVLLDEGRWRYVHDPWCVAGTPLSRS